MAYIQIQWTTDQIDEAKEIAKELVLKRWVSCANILPGVKSFYIWENKFIEDLEVKVFFKTKDDFFIKIRDYIIKHAKYEVPEISKFLIVDINPEYAAWMLKQLK